MIKSIILVDDHALLLNGITNWIENHSDYKVKFQAGSFNSADFLAVALNIATSLLASAIRCSMNSTEIFFMIFCMEFAEF